MKIDIASILNLKNLGAIKGLSKTTAGSGCFHSILGKSLQASAGRTPFNHHPHKAFQTSETVQTKNYQAYFEALRSGLLAKGKPFDQICLKREDAHLVKNLLSHFGYSQKRIDQCLDTLLENSRTGEIQLSQLLTQLKEMGPPENEKSCQVVLAPSTAPYIASVLSEFNLNSDEISKVLTAGQTKEGNIDFNRLVKEIELVSNPSTRSFSGVVDLEKSRSITENLGNLGIQVPSIKKSGLLHIEDFVNSLRRMAGTLSKAAQHMGVEQESFVMTPDDLKQLSIQMPQTGNLSAQPSKEKLLPGKSNGNLERGRGIPSEVQAAIKQVLENTEGATEKNDSMTSIIKGSKIKFDEPAHKELQSDKVKAGQQPVESSEKTGHQTTAGNENLKLAETRSTQSVKTDADISAQSPATDTAEPEIISNKPKLKLVEAAEETVEHRRTESITTVHSKTQKPGAALPNYLIDQLGKQISRSISRGDGVIKFQLKPQELGFIKIEMQLLDNQLNLSVAAENGSVKELLLSNIHELREALMGQGVKLDKLDIQINDGFNQSLSDSQQGLEKERGSNHGETGRRHFFSKGDQTESVIETPEFLRSDSTIDLVA
jgi:flagellar hook-length control protein FliK